MINLKRILAKLLGFKDKKIIHWAPRQKISGASKVKEGSALLVIPDAGDNGEMPLTSQGRQCDSLI